MTTYNIAIDGPAGAGKSTIARKAAAKLGFIYVDTGAMYRAMALYFLRKGIDRGDEKAIEAACGEITISLEYREGVQKVFLNGEDVSGLIRTEEVSAMTSAVSVYSAVRQIYLTAGSRVRAERRFKELEEKGEMCNLEEIEQDIIERDYRDMHRDIAPLKQAKDAVYIDSSRMSIDQVAQAIVDAARERGLEDDR